MIFGGAYFLCGFIWAAFSRMERPVSTELINFHCSEQMKSFAPGFCWQIKTLLMMSPDQIKISIRGKQTEVPFISLNGVEVITLGKWLKIATIRDEDYFDGGAIENPENFVAEFRQKGGNADIFLFSQRIPDITRRYDYPTHWDNAAAIALSDYTSWWNGLSQDTRRNVRLANKRGVEIARVSFSDKLVHGIVGIYNETPVRQGRHFWHFGKDFETVKRENGTFGERSQFLSPRIAVMS